MCVMLSELSKKKYEYDRNYRDDIDWKHRIECNGTPNPQVVQELNTYLFIWRQVPYVSDDKNSYVDKCLEIFNIIDAVDDIMDLPLDLSKASRTIVILKTVPFQSLYNFFIYMQKKNV